MSANRPGSAGREAEPTLREVELKLALGAAAVQPLLRHPRLLACADGAPRRHTLVSVYYDTPDLALWRAGLVLRARQVGRRLVVGVKTRGVVRGGFVSREEHERPLAGADPRRVRPAALVAAIAEPRLRRAVERAARGARLGPRVETRFVRTALPVRVGPAHIELAVDLGETRAGRARFPIREVELELLAGPPRALFDLALQLARDVELQPASVGKAERAFSRLARSGTAAVRAARLRLPSDASLEEVLRALLGECLRQLTANREAVRAGDAEGVHQMRVAARRLRSALRLFAPWLSPRAVEALGAELRWLAAELGRARDLDVFLGDLLAPLAASRRRDGDLCALVREAESARSEAYAAVRAALDSRRYALLVLALGRFAEAPRFRAGGAAPRRARARAALRPALRRGAAKVGRLGARIERLEARELHRLRIRVKRLRYSVELVGSLYGAKRSARAVRRLAALQDRLGHVQDLASAEALLGRVRARVEPSPASTRAAGIVLGYAAASAAASRTELRSAWKRWARLARHDPPWEASP